MKTKRIIVVIAIVIFSLTQSKAQNTLFGIKADVNMSNFILEDLADWQSDFGAGASVGGLVRTDIGKYFAIQSEILFHFKNSEFKIDGMKNKFRFWGMEIPAYAVFYWITPKNDRAFIGIGPYGQIGFSAKNRTINRNYYADFFKKKASFMQIGDVGCGILLGYEFLFGMQINASYKYGLLNQLNEPLQEETFMRNQSVSLGVGYRF